MQAFGIDKNVKYVLDECKGYVIDETSFLDKLKSVKNSGSYAKTIKERLKKRRENLYEEAISKEKELEPRIKSLWEESNFPIVYLWQFFLGLTGLLLIGIERLGGKFSIIAHESTGYYIHFFWTILIVLSLVCITHFYLKKVKSLLLCIKTFAFSILLCLILTGYSIYDPILYNPVSSIANRLWEVTLLFSMTLLFSAFLVSIIKIWHIARRTRTALNKEIELFKNKCDSFYKDFKDISKDINTETILTTDKDNIIRTTQSDETNLQARQSQRTNERWFLFRGKYNKYNNRGNKKRRFTYLKKLK